MYDVDIRRALRNEVEDRHRGDPDTRIVDELGLRQGEVRVDVAVVNGVLRGYEIKSLADTLRRLPTQIRVYSEVLDYAAIVLAESHRADALDMVPSWWEVVIATGNGDDVRLEVERDGEANPSIDKRALAELLWHVDALSLLRSKNAHRALSRRPRSYAWDRVADVCTLDEIRDAVRLQLKGRPLQRAAR